MMGDEMEVGVMHAGTLESGRAHKANRDRILVANGFIDSENLEVELQGNPIRSQPRLRSKFATTETKVS